MGSGLIHSQVLLKVRYTIDLLRPQRPANCAQPWHSGEVGARVLLHSDLELFMSLMRLKKYTKMFGMSREHGEIDMFLRQH